LQELHVTNRFFTSFDVVLLALAHNADSDILNVSEFPVPGLAGCNQALNLLLARRPLLDQIELCKAIFKEYRYALIAFRFRVPQLRLKVQNLAMQFLPLIFLGVGIP